MAVASLTDTEKTTKKGEFMEKRTTFTGQLGFVIATAGSAVGLGNIWRFPYLAAKYGGGIFLLVYIILTLTFGYTLMISENVIGRKTGKGPLVAFSELNKKWGFLGVIALIIPCIILPYYNVIGGWIIKYALMYLTGKHSVLADGGYFKNVMLQDAKQLVGFQLLFTGITTLVILNGVQKGIEKFSKICMPALILLAIIISVYSISLPGAKAGVKYFFIPDFSRFSWVGVIAAMGQMFYSLSLAMGIMIAYSSYLTKETNLEKSVSQIEIFDTAIAILAGLMIIPAVFAFSGGDESALGQGTGLMFVTLPQVFEKMGFTSIIGVLFFLLVLFAAITSSVSIMEAIVSSICDKAKISRKKSTIIVGIYGFVVGVFPALGYNVLSGVHIMGFDILDFMDFITNNILMPICALLTCIFIAWVMGVGFVEKEVTSSGQFKRKGIYNIMVKYVAPVLLLVILVSSILSGMGLLKI